MKSDQKHHFFEVRLRKGNYACKFEIFDQSSMIFNYTSSISGGSWLEQLTTLNIGIRDLRGSFLIEVPIDACLAGKLYTRSKEVRKCGLVVMELLMEWMLMDRVLQRQKSCSILITSSLLHTDYTASNNCKHSSFLSWMCWIYLIRLAKKIAEKQQTIAVDEKRCDETKLPWIDSHTSL